ncbi:NACHT domain-containing protein [Streptomyces pilosus]|uniref:NACHT domain-containing protein n=1 Tax=Streptomyces pilosus TaxID=28893 RepID=UPI0036FEB5E6
MGEIVTSAVTFLGRAAAAPVKDAALRRPEIVNILKKLRLDPKQPPRDFYSLYAYALVEGLYGKSDSLLKLFNDEYVQQSFFRSFSDGDWSRLEREVAEAVERNRETREFGHLPYDVDSETREFIDKFQELVSRSRMAYEARVENKLDNVSNMLDQVLRTRDEEEEHRQSEDPKRAVSRPEERLGSDVQVWFQAVGYRIRDQWHVGDFGMALSVEVPQRRRGRYDLVLALCVDGELAPYHLEVLQELVCEQGFSEGWGIAQLRVSEAARRLAEHSDGALYCYSFDELIDLEADFEPYIAWLEKEVRTRHIDSRFVPLSCRKEEIDPRTEKSFGTSEYDWRDGGLDKYVDSWLADPAKKHLSLLGEFGMGKSWFALHLAGRLAAGWKDAKARGVARPRIPLIIPLRDYAKQTSVSALLSEFFFHKHQIEIRNYEVFNVLNQMGRFLLIFDGFDEMASRTDRNTMVANFWELAKVVEPGAKVLLSSRTEYFPEAKEARDLFDARVSAAATSVPSEGPTFEIVELVPFDDEQIRRMLSHLLAPEKLAIVMEHEGVRDLMRRPVMSELVIDALPEIEQGAAINLARIYLYAIKRKMDRDVSSERTFTSRADKLFFLCEVAWEMIRTNQLSLNYKDFPEKLRACFGSVVESAQDLDYWEQDMRNQSMLVRNARGDYGPSHKSLLEFLIAFRFAAELGLLQGDYLRLIPGAEKQGGKPFSWSEYFTLRGDDGEFPGISAFRSEDVDKLADTFGSAEYNPVVFDFLAAMVKESNAYQPVLLAHIRDTARAVDARSLGGNCAHLLVQAGGNLAGADLSGSSLSGLGRSGDTFIDLSLEGADLSHSDLTGCTLSYFDKRGANFAGARLRGSDFLISRVVAQDIIIQASGAVTVLRITTHDGRPWDLVEAIALHWPSGDISTQPMEFPLREVDPNSFLAGCRIFAWGSEAWGSSDAEGTVIRSTITGEVLKRYSGRFASAVSWGNRLAAVEVSGPHLSWRVVDPDSGEMLAECDDDNVRPQGVNMWAMVPTSRGVALWSATESQSRRAEMTAETGGLLEETVTFAVGTANAVSKSAGIEVLADDDTVYVHDHEFTAHIFARQEVGDALDELSSAHYQALTPDRRHMVVASGHTLSVWDVGLRPWRRLWSQPISSSLSTSPGFSEGGNYVLIGLRSGELMAWSVQTGELLSVISLNPHLRDATFSHEGDLNQWEQDTILRSGGRIEEG